jgi:hypothetical protein
MLQFDTGSSHPPYSGHSDSGCNSPLSTASTRGASSTLSATDSATLSVPDNEVAKSPTSQSDPAIKSNSYRYSRPMEDISTLVIVYTSHRATPSVCATAAFEHDSLCKRSATPGDFSETFDYGPRPHVEGYASKISSETDGSQGARRKIANIAAKRVMSSGMASNRELVEHIWGVWHNEFSENGMIERDWLGRVKYSWQEVKSIIDNGGLGRQGLPDGWPVGE